MTNTKNAEATPTPLPLRPEGHRGDCGCDECANWQTPFWGGLWAETLAGGDLAQFSTMRAAGYCLSGATGGTRMLREAVEQYGAESVVFSLMWLVRALDEPGWRNRAGVVDMESARRAGAHYAGEEEYDRRRDARREELRHRRAALRGN